MDDHLFSKYTEVRKRLIWVWILAVLWGMAVLPAAVFAADGSLDATFGTAGIVTTDIANLDNRSFDLAVQDDGKILVAGYAFIGGNNDIAVLRYNSDGSLDTNFDGDGIVTTDVDFNTDRGNAVAVQDDGKILVAGFARIGTTNDIVLLRYNSDGSLDTNFDGDGIVTTDVAGGNDFGEDLAIQSDSKILVAGYASNGLNSYDAVLLRYNPDGSIDNTFGTNGKVTTDIGGGTRDFFYAVTIQSDGRILLAGYSEFATNNRAVLLRHESDGSLDATFGTAGIVANYVGFGIVQIYALSLQGDGRILAAGYVFNGANNDILLLRYDSDGSLDMTFDADGIVTTDVAGASDIGQDIAIQSDGRILVAGYSSNGTDYDAGLLRYNSDGSLHTGFDGDGIVTTDVAGDFDYIHSVILQSDDKIVLAGYLRSGGDHDVVLLRYENTIPIPDDDGGDGNGDDSSSSGCFISAASGGSPPARTLFSDGYHSAIAESIRVCSIFGLLGGLIVLAVRARRTEA